jgi:GT2 family glycosyltransferase/glycosyltransferase involved in cell wall biosynthesis
VDQHLQTSTPADEKAEASPSESLVKVRTRRGAEGSGVRRHLAPLGRTGNPDFLARVTLQAQVDRLTEERVYLARELSRAYRQPLRPFRHALHYWIAKVIGTASAAVAPRLSDWLVRSARAHSPKRFDTFLRDPGPAAARLKKFGPILTADDPQPLALADVERVSLPVSGSPRVSIIIPSYGRAWLTLQCLKSIAMHPPRMPFEVIVVDDASGDPDVVLLGRAKGVRLEINPSNVGFLKSCNRAAEKANGDYLFLLNNDTLTCEDWLEPLASVFDEFSDAGLAGAKLLFPDGSLQEAGGIVWSDGSAMNYGRFDNSEKPEYNYIRQVDYISGCAILIPRGLWRELGGFDERFSPGYCEDSDLAFRIRALGKTVYYCPSSVVVHLEGASHGTDLASGVKAHQVENTRKLFERWRDTLAAQHLPPGADIMLARDRSRHRKTALIVDRYVPEPDKDAGSRTIMAMIIALLDSGYVVKFWSDDARYNSTYTPVLQNIGVETIYGQYYSFDDWIKENGRFISLAVLSRPGVAPRYIATLRAHSNATIAYYGHDLHYRRMAMEAMVTGDSALAADAAAVEAQEQSIWRDVDVVLYPSEDEAEAARGDAALAAAIVPYAYDDFGDARTPPQNHEILFVAGFAHAPNASAAEWLAADIFPRILELVPDARISLVGSDPTESVRALASDRVEVTGRVSDDELRARYVRARLALVPLRVGAGVKSKVVEALREGLPLVTTGVGGQGLPGIVDIAKIADDAAGLANAATRLLLDDALWTETSRRQADYARKRFSRETFRRTFVSVLTGDMTAKS